MNDTSTNYDDIIDMQWPKDTASLEHPRMALSNRAKIFLPFAALKGYGEELEKRRKKHAAMDENKSHDEFLSEED